MPDISGVCSVLGTFEITSKPTNAASTRIAISVIEQAPTRCASAHGGAGRRLRALVDDLSAPRDAGAGDHLVVEVELELALVDHQPQQRLDVAGVELRGVLGHRRGHVQRGDDLDVVAQDGLPGSESSQLPPVSAARSTITEPGFISFTACSVTRIGARPPGHGRGRDHDVGLADRLGHQLLLLCLLLGRELLGVAARRPRVAAEVELQELGAQRLDLLLDRRADVESLTTAPSRRAVAIACSPATPAPSTSTVAGRIVPAAVISIG